MPDLYSNNSIGFKSDQIKSSYDGSAWTAAPDVIQFSARLLEGTSSTIVLEVRDARMLVVTAVTLILTSTDDILHDAILSKGYESFRFRQTSGTGTVLITV